MAKTKTETLGAPITLRDITCMQADLREIKEMLEKLVAGQSVEHVGKPPKVDLQIEEKLPVKPEDKITLADLQTLASKAASTAGMETVKSIIAEHGGGVKKLSQASEECFPALHAAFTAALAEPAAEEEAESPGVITISKEVLVAAAKVFMEKNGAPAFKELLGTFGANKIGELGAEKYAALHEALVNA